MTEERLREEDHERLAEVAVDLTTEDVELEGQVNISAPRDLHNTYVVGRRRGVDDLHVAVLVLPLDLLGRGVDVRVVVAELEEPLETSA